MSELLCMSFDASVAPAVTFHPDAEPRQQPGGWGFGWYPNDEETAVVLKDPTSAGDDAISESFAQWDRFRSTSFLAHFRGAERTRRQRDAQPFLKSYAGRGWVFAHNGDLTGDWKQALPLGVHPVFEPLGTTDSEHAFCWLLTVLRTEGARTLADFGYARLLDTFAHLNDLGTANIAVCDGRDLVVYGDRNGFNGLVAVRRVPPHDGEIVDADIVSIRLEDPLERARSMVVCATVGLAGEAWQSMAGRMLVLRRGSVIWDSDAQSDEQPGKAGRNVPLTAAGTSGAAAVAPPDAALPPQAPQQQAFGHAGPEQQQVHSLGAQASAEQPRDPGIQGFAPTWQPTTSFGVARRAETPPERVLEVFHHTVYRYGSPVEHSEHLLRLHPVHDHFQHCIEYSLDISVDGRRSDFEDVFGNLATALEVRTPFTELSIRTHAVARLIAPAPLEHHHPGRREQIPLVWMPWQRQMMWPYLLPPELPESELRELSTYAMSFVERNEYDLFETLLDMNQTIHRDYAYVSGSTTLETTPFEVYLNRRGVCQDFANLLICLARLLGVPARYRVGYIYTGGDYANRLQSDASHAWVELYLPMVGWRGFDPTNGCLTGLDHVRVACGRNYRDATPTSGTIYRGGGDESLTVEVRVQEVKLDDPAPSPPNAAVAS